MTDALGPLCGLCHPIRDSIFKREGTPMGDFVTLLCPRCGGKLAVAPNAITLICDHCGTQHMVRRDVEGVMLESYARCPVCHRNDRAEKVTAILMAHTHETEGVTYTTVASPEQAEDDEQNFTERVAVPIHTSQRSELAKRLAPPQPPVFHPPSSERTSSRSRNAAIGLIAAGGACLPFALLRMLSLVPAVFGMDIFDPGSFSREDAAIIATSSLGCLGAAVVLLAAGLLLFFFVVPKEREANAAKLLATQARLQEYNARVQRETDRYNLAMTRWDQLYYCGRDDCVFLPSTNTYAPLAKLAQYLAGDY